MEIYKPVLKSKSLSSKSGTFHVARSECCPVALPPGDEVPGRVTQPRNPQSLGRENAGTHHPQR